MAMQSIKHARDRHLRGSMAAMRRAAQRAHRLALVTHTDLIVAKAGKWQRVKPSKVQEAPAEYAVGSHQAGTDSDDES